MDRYYLVVLVMLLAGMGISITRDPPQLIMFYTMLAGAIVVIILQSRKNRKQQGSHSNSKSNFGSKKKG